MWKILLCIGHCTNSKEVKANVQQACFLSVCLKRAASGPLQPLRTTRQSGLRVSSIPEHRSAPSFSFQAILCWKCVIGDAFCIIPDQAHICIVNKSICHFSCSALSQCTGLRGQNKTIINGVMSRFYHN